MGVGRPRPPRDRHGHPAHERSVRIHEGEPELAEVHHEGRVARKGKDLVGLLVLLGSFALAAQSIQGARGEVHAEQSGSCRVGDDDGAVGELADRGDVAEGHGEGCLEFQCSEANRLSSPRRPRLRRLPTGRTREHCEQRLTPPSGQPTHPLPPQAPRPFPGLPIAV